MKLLNRYLVPYITCSAIVLIAAIPVLYFSIQQLVAGRLDQNLLRQKKLIVSSLGYIGSADSLSHLIWAEPGIRFRPALPSDVKADKFSVVMRFDSIDHDQEPRRMLETLVSVHGKPYLLEISSSLLDKEQLIAGIFASAFFVLLLIVTGLVLLNRFLSVRIWKPFYTTVARLNNYKIEDDEVLYFETTPVNEFNDLNKAVYSLTHRNGEVFRSQRAFIENTSHEMQTPVAVQQVKLDLFLQTEPLSEEQHTLLADLMNITQRMGILHNCLLLLAKIENQQFRDTELFSARAMLENLVEQYRLQATMKKISIRLHLADDLMMNANKGLIEILMGNLISNAIRHNVQGGVIHITSMIRTLIFTNTGVNRPLEKDKMFRRFEKQSSADGSAGLGLHIAKKIAEYYGCRLCYDFKDGHHSFIITLQNQI